MSATVTWFVGNLSKNSDGIPTMVTVISVNRNVIGSSSVYSEEFPTTTTVICFIGMSSKSRRKIPTSHVSSEFRRKWPTEFWRLQIFGFRRKLVGNPSQMSDDIEVRRNLCRNSACFLVVILYFIFWVATAATLEMRRGEYKTYYHSFQQKKLNNYDIKTIIK